MTLPRIFRQIRPGFDYTRSLGVLTLAREHGLVTKSNLILGMGETPAEISQALREAQVAAWDAELSPSQALEVVGRIEAAMG